MLYVKRLKKRMDTETPKDLDRQQPVNAQSVSNSYEDQLETNNNLAPIEDTPNHLLNGTADIYAIIPVASDIPEPSAPTNPTEEGHLEPRNLMPEETGNAPMVYEPPIEESVGDEHDERDLIVPIAV